MADTIKTTVQIDTTEAQAEIIKLNGVASDATKSLQERIEAKNKSVEKENELQKQTIQALEDNVKALNEQGASEKELQKATNSLNKERLKEQKTLVRQEKELNKLNAQVEKQANANDVAEDSVIALRKRHSELLKTYDQSSAAVRDQMLPEINALRESISNAEEASGRFSRNVGNYPDIMSAASAGFAPLVAHMKGMVLQARAFIATPFGAIISAIVAVAALFNKTIKESEELTTEWNKITNVMSQTLGELTNVVTPLVEVTLKALGFIVQKVIIPAFTTLSSIITPIVKIITGDFKNGIVELTNAVKNMGTTFLEAQKGIGGTFNAARELAEIDQQLNEQRRELTVTNATLEVQAKEALRDSKDYNKSLDERLDALDDYNAAQMDILENERQLLQLELERDKLESSLAGDDADFKQQLADREAALISLDSRIADQERNALNRRKSLINEQEKFERAAEAERTRMQNEAEKERENLRIQMEREEAKAIIEREKLAEERREKQKDEMRRDAEAEIQLAQIELERLREQGEATLELEQSILERKRLQALDNEELTRLEILAINEKYDKLQEDAESNQIKIVQDAEKAKIAARTASISSASKGIGDLFGFGKEAALADLGIQTGKAVSQAWSSNSALPFPASATAAGAELAASLPAIASGVNSVKGSNLSGAPSSGGSSPSPTAPPSTTGSFDSVFADAGNQLNEAINNDLALSSSNNSGSLTSSQVVLTEGTLNSFNQQVEIREANSSF